MALEDYPSVEVILLCILVVCFTHYVLPALHCCCIGACTKKKYGAHEINVAITDVENQYSVSQVESKIRSEKRVSRVSRVLSMHFTLGAYAWIVYFAVTSSMRYDEIQQGTKLVFNILGYIHLPAFILFLWVESLFSRECGYLGTKIEEESCKTYIQKLKEQKPTVAMVIGAYHYETRYKTHTYMANEQIHLKMESYKERVQDYNKTLQFPFNRWEDYTPDPSTLDLSPGKVTRVKMLKLVLLGDEETKTAFDRIQGELKTKVQALYPNSQIEFYIDDGVSLFVDRLSAYWEIDEARWWTNRFLFIILSFLLLTWFYRIAYSFTTQSICFRVVKKIYISD